MKRTAFVYLAPTVASLSLAERNGGKLAPGVWLHRRRRTLELGERGTGKLHSLGQAAAIHTQPGRTQRRGTAGLGARGS